MDGWEPREAGKMVEAVAELQGVAVAPLDMGESQMLERKRAKAETTGREEHWLGLQLQLACMKVNCKYKEIGD